MGVWKPILCTDSAATKVEEDCKFNSLTTTLKYYEFQTNNMQTILHHLVSNETKQICNNPHKVQKNCLNLIWNTLGCCVFGPANVFAGSKTKKMLDYYKKNPFHHAHERLS